jgi:hypothetical protein
MVHAQCTVMTNRGFAMLGDRLYMATLDDRLPKTHVFPVVGKLRSAIQADNIRFALDGTEFDRVCPRKRGLSMLTAKNKVEEWPYHRNPQDKFTISNRSGRRI